jgi:alkylated DNA repair protein (DNA oxidative demethylase)
LRSPILTDQLSRSNHKSAALRRYRLEHGDIAVWGGPARLAFQGVAPLADGEHALMGLERINLTFRKVH